MAVVKPTFQIREQPFNSRIARDIVLELDAELLAMYPDWNDLVHPNIKSGNPQPEDLPDEDVPHPQIDVDESTGTNTVPHDQLKFFVAFASVSSLTDKSAEKPVGCVALRYLPSFPSHDNPVTVNGHLPKLLKQTPTEPPTAELKRMYVARDARGSGLSDQLVEHAQRYARTEMNMNRLVLETGVRQVAAIKLYRRHGFLDRSVYGDYIGASPADGGISVCFEKWLA